MGLVAVSLILLTAYFGESRTSPLHNVQRGIVQVLSPVQEGASTALSPVRDVAGWFSDTFGAKSQVDQLQKQVAGLKLKLGQSQQKAIGYSRLAREVGLDRSAGIGRYHPVGASVIARDPTLWYATIEVDAGSANGVRYDDPVIGDGGLVGRVTTVTTNASIVTLITDHSMAVAAEVEDSSGDTGVLVPAVGNPNQLLLQYLPQSPPFHESVGQLVVTAGFKYGALEGLYPSGIPIGTVSSADTNNLANNGQVQVKPTVDLRHVDAVQILTTPHPGTARAQVP